MRWQYGVTTVWSRLKSYTLLETLRSLAAGGFDEPQVFGDGITESQWTEEWGDLVERRHHFTPRPSAVRAYANWVLGMDELYFRDPTADLYAMFQDDVRILPGCRMYVERVVSAQAFPRKAYLNLYLSAHNEPHFRSAPLGWHQAPNCGERLPDSGDWVQNGKGALGLVFTNDGVRALLSSRHLYDRVVTACRCASLHRTDQVILGCGVCNGTGRVVTEKAHRSIDGAVVHAMNRAGYREWVHNPSLMQHEGYESTIRDVHHKQSKTYSHETNLSDREVKFYLNTPAEAVPVVATVG